MIDSLTKQYAADGMFRIWFMFKPVMVLFRARTIEHILKHTVEINKSEEVALVETWLGKGLLTRFATTSIRAPNKPMNAFPNRK